MVIGYDCDVKNMERIVIVRKALNSQGGSVCFIVMACPIVSPPHMSSRSCLAELAGGNCDPD